MINIVKEILDYYEQQKGKRLKILTTKQMLHRLQIAPAQVKAYNTYENLFKKVFQIMYSLYGAKEMTKIVCNNILNSAKA